MKLGALKSAIRATKGSPLIDVELTPGAWMRVALMKAPLLEALDGAYPGGKAVETSLSMNSDNLITADGATPKAPAVPAAPGPLLDLMSDLPTSTAAAIASQFQVVDLLATPTPPVPAAPASTSILSDLLV